MEPSPRMNINYLNLTSLPFHFHQVQQFQAPPPSRLYPPWALRRNRLPRKRRHPRSLPLLRRPQNPPPPPQNYFSPLSSLLFRSLLFQILPPRLSRHRPNWQLLPLAPTRRIFLSLSAPIFCPPSLALRPPRLPPRPRLLLAPEVKSKLH